MEKMRPEGQWIETDAALEAVSGLEMVSEQLTKISINHYYWKWVILALHNSLQGFMVLALRGHNNVNIFTKKCAEEWLAAYEQGRPRDPYPKLADFRELYKRIKSDRMQLYSNSKIFKPNNTQNFSVKKLNSLRNEFIHFVPANWSLGIGGLPQIVKDCINIISFLAFESGNVIWHDTTLEQRTRELIEQISGQVAAGILLQERERQRYQYLTSAG
jgi:hypothetical protein